MFKLFESRLSLATIICAVSIPISLTCLAQEKPAPAPRNNAVQVEMKNIMYHFTDPIVVHVRRLQGSLLPKNQDGIPIFDDKRSFILAINSAEIAISTQAMSTVLNQYVFAAKDAPLKEISIHAGRDSLKVKGKLHQKGDITFETEATIAASSDGQIRLHARNIKAAHLPVKGLMDLFGIELADLINTKKLAGIRAEGDDLILDPQQILPPPHIQGRVSQARLEGDQIVQVFGDARASLAKPETPGNYMAYHGNQLRFGKLTMSDTDMSLIDMDPRDPFDFYLDHYQEQLTAGYTKITPGFGLRVFMRDFNKLPRSRPKNGPSKNPKEAVRRNIQ